MLKKKAKRKTHKKRKKQNKTEELRYLEPSEMS